MLTDRAPRVLHASARAARRCRAARRASAPTDVIAVPLLAGGTFLGVAAAGWPEGEAPDAAATATSSPGCAGVGDQASTALQKARLLETVRHQATHDALTGLPNRALFLDRLEAALAGLPDRRPRSASCSATSTASRRSTTRLGHAAGDELLRQVAARLRRQRPPRGHRRPAQRRRVRRSCCPAWPTPTTPPRLADAGDRLLRPSRSGWRASEVRDGHQRRRRRAHRARRAPPSELLREADAGMYRHKQRAPRLRPTAG